MAATRARVCQFIAAEAAEGMASSKPDLRRSLALACLVVAGFFLLLLLAGRLVSSALNTDAVQDIDVELARLSEFWVTGGRTRGSKRPPGARYNVSGRPAWRSAHDANATFRRLIARREWGPRVLRPPTQSRRGSSWGSWVVLFENFTTAAEAEAIVDAVGDSWRPAEVAGVGPEIATGSRRGDVAWCSLRGAGRCSDRHSLARAIDSVLTRVQAAVGISTDYFETTQLLRYEPGGYYAQHHDSSLSFTRTHGVRMLTAFLYLSDLPGDDAGGETAFPRLPGSGKSRTGGPLLVAPRVGRLVVWPNVRDDQPSRGVADLRMLHEARAVRRGVKYAANVWIRLHSLA